MAIWRIDLAFLIVITSSSIVAAADASFDDVPTTKLLSDWIDAGIPSLNNPVYESVTELEKELLKRDVLVLPYIYDFINSDPKNKNLDKAINLLEAITGAHCITVSEDQKSEAFRFFYRVWIDTKESFMIYSRHYNGIRELHLNADGRFTAVQTDEAARLYEKYWDFRSQVQILLEDNSIIKEHQKIPYRANIHELNPEIEVARRILLEERYGIYNLPRYIKDVGDGDNGIIFWRLMQLMGGDDIGLYNFDPMEYIPETKRLLTHFPETTDRRRYILAWWQGAKSRYRQVLPVLCQAIDEQTITLSDQ